MATPGSPWISFGWKTMPNHVSAARLPNVTKSHMLASPPRRRHARKDAIERTLNTMAFSHRMTSAKVSTYFLPLSETHVGSEEAVRQPTAVQTVINRSKHRHPR